jgi:hypothetical protein
MVAIEDRLTSRTEARSIRQHAVIAAKRISRHR